MKKKIMLFLTAFMVMFTAVVLPAPKSSAYAALYDSETLESYAYQVAAIVNRERAANGLGMLKYSDKLSEAAVVRAGEIQSYFSHTRPNGTSCFTALAESGIRYRYAGENIAYGQRNPEEVMKAWMNSSGHRANILSTKVDYIGIGVTYRNGVYYWSQFFAASDDLDGRIITEGEAPQQTTTTTRVTTAQTTTQRATTTRTTTARTTVSTAKQSTQSSAKTTVTTSVPPILTTVVTVPADQNPFCNENINDFIKLILERMGINIDNIIKSR